MLTVKRDFTILFFTMKRMIFSLLLLLIFSSCASVSFHPMAYVEDLSEYDSYEIQSKVIGKQKIIYGDYEILFSNTIRNEKEVLISDIGTKNENILQKGKVYKLGYELFELSFIENVSGFVIHDKNSTTSLTDSTVTLEIGKTLIPISNDKKRPLISLESPMNLKIENVSTYINEKGKIYHVLFDMPMGAKVFIDDELFAVIDYYQNPAQIRVNKSFSKEISEDNRDFINILMLSAYYFCTSFSNQ